MAKNKNKSREGGSWYGSDVLDTARESPLKSAAIAAAAVGAGVFLWSRRNQLSDQISELSDQVGEWAGNMNLGEKLGMSGDDTGGLTTGSSGASGSPSSSGTSSSARSASSQGQGRMNA